MGGLSRARVSGPLEPYAPGFACELSRQGYSPFTVVDQLRLMAHLSRWLAGEELDGSGLTPDALERFLDARRGAGYARYRSPGGLVPLLDYLRGLGVAPALGAAAIEVGPVEVLLERYRRYLTVERGLVDRTVDGYVSLVEPFLAGRIGAGGLDLEHLTTGDVSAFVRGWCREGAGGSGKRVSALRSLLGFLHVQGLISGSLVGAVPSVAYWRLAGLPRALEADQVRRLLASCDRASTTGRRDFAILMLLGRLGLRRGEVAAIELDDLDWRAGEILVRGKGNRHERLPLPADVGQAVADHLRPGRPKSAEGRCVFLRFRAPHRALSANGVGSVVVAAGRRAGLGAIGAHRLRHTAATEMLRAGASLAEIGQVLRHRRASSTSIYAKVDREVLRSLAQPWPGGAA